MTQLRSVKSKSELDSPISTPPVTMGTRLETALPPEGPGETSPQLAHHLELALLILVVTLGAGLRVAHFFTTGSLFYDEACVALNLVTRHPWQLFEPLAYNQAAAPGFLLLEKCLAHFFGTSELVLRLPALLGSIAVLILLAILCEQLFNRWLAILAVAILGISPLAILFASELKPYSTDAAFTLWMMIRFRSLLLYPAAKKQWLLFLLSGVIALLFSQAVIFVLLSLSLLLIGLKFRERRSAVTAGFVVTTWLGLFSLLYFTIYRSENTSYMQIWWSSQTLSILKPQFAARAVPALRSLTLGSLDSLSYLHLEGVILILALGVYFTARRAGVMWASALTLPYAAIILASALGFFPIEPRLLFFIVPLLVVLVATGIESLLAKALRSPSYRLCCSLVLFLIVGNGARQLMYTVQRIHFPRLSKSLISQCTTAPNCAAVYVFADSIPVWEFYAREAGVESPPQDTYQKVFDRNSERVFAENPKPPLPEALTVYRLGCKPLILGDLLPVRSRGPVSQRSWARSELTRITSSGTRIAYIFGELYPPETLQSLLDEAGSMGASIQPLGGGRHYSGYLSKIEFASSPVPANGPIRERQKSRPSLPASATEMVQSGSK